ncbi:MAG TPA: alpha-L-arabinofuranosidase C-terminal domain-containing protein, partial [Streptosporangiaceae bacterium]
ALAVGTYLNIFTRNCDWVRMANLAQMVNAIAPIVTTPETAVTQTIWYPILLHAQAALNTAVDVYTDGSTIDLPAGSDPGRWPHRVSDLGPFPMVDAAATVSPDRGRIALTLVNRNPDQAETAEIVVRDLAFDGPVELHTVTAAPGTASAVPGVQAARVDEGSEATKGGTVTITLPPRSFTTVEAALARE